MSGVRQTTASLKEKIRQAASQRDIELDGIDVREDDDQRRFRVIETDGETEADQVGFEIVEPGGPAGDMMFNRRLQQYMDELRKHVEGNDADTVDDTDSDETDVEADDSDYAGPGPDEGREMNSSAEEVFDTDAEDTETHDTRPTPGPTADVTVAFDESSIDDLTASVREAVDETTADQDEIEARLDELDERVRQIENALSAISHVSQPDD